MRAFDVPVASAGADKVPARRARGPLTASLHQAAGATPADLSVLADIMFDRLMKLTEGNDGTHATTLPPPGH